VPAQLVVETQHLGEQVRPQVERRLVARGGVACAATPRSTSARRRSIAAARRQAIGQRRVSSARVTNSGSITAGEPSGGRPRWSAEGARRPRASARPRSISCVERSAVARKGHHGVAEGVKRRHPHQPRVSRGDHFSLGISS
jgi:hypothetical protein